MALGGIAGRVVAIAVAAALGAGAAACGNDEEEVTRVVTDFQESFARGDVDGVCALLTDAAHEHVGGSGHDAPSSCRLDMRKVLDWMRIGGVRPERGRRIVDVQVDGDSATATVAVGGGDAIELPLARVDGEWKVNGVYGNIPAELQENKL